MTLLINAVRSPYSAEAIQRFVGANADGKWGPDTETRVAIKLGRPVDSTGRPWKRHRLLVGIVQTMLNAEGANIEVDGLLGPLTIEAIDLKVAGKLMQAPPEKQADRATKSLWQRIKEYVRT